MADKTGIEWTDATWNCVTGCTKVSPGCDHCYAETFAERWRGTPGHHFEHGFDVQLRPERLDLPLKWRKPRRIFVNSMSDLFHDEVPDEFIAEMFAVMALAQRHTFQVLTKRHGRMRSLLNSGPFIASVTAAFLRRAGKAGAVSIADPGSVVGARVAWPLPNVWTGVSVESSRYLYRVDALRETPAAIRFLSCEPLIGPLGEVNLDGIGWVIAGGESGPGARPMHPDWVRSLRDQCAEAGVPFLMKQWGAHRWIASDRYDEATQCWVDGPLIPERVSKKLAGRLLDGVLHDEYPAVA